MPDNYDIRGKALAKAKEGMPLTAEERKSLNEAGEEMKRYKAMIAANKKDKKGKKAVVGLTKAKP